MPNRFDAITVLITFIITKALITLGGCYSDHRPHDVPPQAQAAEQKDASR